MTRNVLLLKAGEAAPEVRRSVGDYDRMFVQAVAEDSRWRLHVHQTHLGEALPRRARDWDAIWMTGSPKSVRELEPWMLPAADFMREAAEQNVPVLGVCFGHQLLGHAHGARVVKNVHGREVGTIDVKVTPEGQRDPLFRGLGDTASFQSTHEDILERAPEGAVVLATNAMVPVQSFALGKYLRGVQFHPEIAPDGMRAMIDARAASLNRDAVARNEREGVRVRSLLAGVRTTPAGRQLLLNFLEQFT